MKKPVKNLLKTVAAVILIIGAALAYVSFALPKAGKAPDLEVKITPEKVERGKYLAYHVMMCADCHSERNFSLFSGPPHPGTEFSGGGCVRPCNGFSGQIYLLKHHPCRNRPLV